LVLSGVQERLAPLQTWLFPQRLYLELQDQAITAMALKGRRVQWLDQIAIPPGLCAAGRLLNGPALVDLLGDWLVESGYAGARVSAVLPGSATELRLLRGEGPFDSSRFALPKQLAPLALPWPLETPVDVLCCSLPSLAGSTLSVAVEAALLEGWLELFADAGFNLDSLEASPICALRALQLEGGLLLGVESDQSWLISVEQGAPIWQWRLPPLNQLQSLQTELNQCLSYFKTRKMLPASISVVACAALPSAPLETLQRSIPLQLDWFDPLAAGQLESSLNDLAGHSLGLLWGLAAAEMQP